MQIKLKQLKHYSVETASGLKLGHVSDIVLDTDGQMITQYEVKESIISAKEYLIGRDQIARFEDKKLIVDDNAIQEKTTAPEPAAT